MSLAERIRDTRRSKGRSQAQVADCLEMDAGNYSKLEKRGERITLEQLQRIADALDVPLAKLLGIETDTITEVQTVGVETMLRFRKKESALKAAVQIYLDMDRFERKDLLNYARKYEAYLDED